MDNIQELRFTPRPQVRSDSGGGRTISGYAAVFNQITDVGGQFLEQISPGAFSRAIRLKQNVACLINHDPSRLVARVSAGNLTLREDTRGLFLKADVARTVDGDTLLELIRIGAWSQCSFGFVATKDNWTRAKDANGNMRDCRSITDVDLYDVSIVTDPQYSGTTVALAATAAAASSSMPVELRSRITATVEPAISHAERELRERARAQAARLLAEDGDDFVTYAKRRNAEILKSL